MYIDRLLQLILLWWIQILHHCQQSFWCKVGTAY